MKQINKIEQLFAKGKITRRDFLARLSALGITASLSPALFGTTAQAATPKKGGRLRLGMAGGATTDTLDPALISDSVAHNISFQARNCLVEIDASGNAIPELAENWESTPDATKWIFNLRKDVEFHNGKTMTSEDVKFSINHHRSEESKSAAKALAKQIEEIKIDGKNTVIFTLKGGSADFPYLLSDYHFQIVPNGTAGKEWDKGIGTGGYILEKHEPGVRAFSRKNPNYWKEGRAHFDEVETIIINDAPARTTALKTDAIDVMNRCDVKTVHLLKKVKGLQIINVTGPKFYDMPMLVDVPPYDNNDVRLALKYAIDREQLINIVLGGYGSVGNDHPIGPSYRFHASEAEIPQRMYDPDKARFHLKKAGMDGHTFNIHAADAAFLGGVDTVVLFREQAAKAGIKVKIVREPNDGYWSNVWMNKSWCVGYWAGRGTADWMFSVGYAAEAAWNYTRWKHERFNKLLVEARAELDESKRREMYVEMQRICSDEGGTIIPVFADILLSANTRLKYNKVGALYDMDNQRNTECWWFA